MLSTDTKHPDDALHVTFYKHAVKNEFLSEAHQRPIFEDRDFIRIVTPGDQLNVVETFVREDHKTRFPRQWAHYQNMHESKEVGTPIEHWPLITRAQAEELKGIKFYTVEAVAGASDAQLQKIGMIGGINAFRFREKAQQFLSQATSEAQKSAHDAEIERLRLEREEQAKKIAELQAQMADILSTQPRRGRPPKEELTHV